MNNNHYDFQTVDAAFLNIRYIARDCKVIEP